MIPDDGRHDGQSKAGATSATSTRGVRSEERVEDALGVLWAYSHPVIGHFEQHGIFGRHEADLDRHPPCGVLDGVRKQVVHHLAEALRISPDRCFDGCVEEHVPVG